MWWNMAPELRSEFEDWHSHEHFPERMSVPGFRRGSRWANKDGAEDFFVLYELDTYGTLTSPHYLSRLNDPTPWSTKMMPHHRDMVRSQCRIHETYGGGLAQFMLTLRFSPMVGRAEALHKYLTPLLARLPLLPGITGGHLLRTETPNAPTTAEQMIRGGDAVADWIVLVSGYDSLALEKVAEAELSGRKLKQAGALPSSTIAIYHLSFALAQTDFCTRL
jgi:hypothetical protein